MADETIVRVEEEEGAVLSMQASMRAMAIHQVLKRHDITFTPVTVLGMFRLACLHSANFGVGLELTKTLVCGELDVAYDAVNRHKAGEVLTPSALEAMKDMLHTLSRIKQCGNVNEES